MYSSFLFSSNSHINVAGTTTFDIGNDVTFDSSVLNTNHLTRQVGGDLKVTSRQDTATYEGKQQNIGASLEVNLIGGAGNSLSVREQAVIATQTSDLVVGGKGNFIGGALTTATPEDNHTVFKQGIETQDITNHSRYKGDSISAGISIGNTTGKPQANMNGIGYGSDGDSQTSTTFAGVTGMAGKSEVTTASKDSLNEPLKNSFDVARVTEELGAQTQITKEFGKEAPKAVAEFSGKQETKLILEGNLEEAKKWSEGGRYRVALHTLTSALATGSIEGAFAGGDTASTVSSVNQTQNNYLNHLQLQKWADQLKVCDGEKYCIEGINDYYLDLEKKQQTEFLKTVKPIITTKNVINTIETTMLE